LIDRWLPHIAVEPAPVPVPQASSSLK